MNRTRLAMAAALILAIVAGLASRRMDTWPALANGLGAVLYEIAGMAFLLSLWPRARVRVIAAVVCLGTCVVELAQLSTASWLVAIRSTTPGRLLLGANGGFDYVDFPLYILGCGLGLVLFGWLQALTRPRPGSREPRPAPDGPGS